MPKFLDEPDIRGLKPQRGIRDSGEADALNSLARTVDFVGGEFSKKRRAEEAISARDEARQYADQKQRESEAVAQEKGQAIGDATTSILDLKEERANLLDEEDDVRGQIRNIYSDDLVTEEEKATLDSLSDKKSRLDRARKTGMLNETAYNTRYNATWKQSLSNVGNLALQSEINSIFGSGIATFEEPAEVENAQLTAKLDQIHGVGNHGIQERGKYEGKLAYIQTMQKAGEESIINLSGQISNVSSAINSVSVGGLLTAVKSNAGVMTDVHLGNYRLAAQASLHQMRITFNQSVAEARERGEVLDPETLKEMATDLEEDSKFYLETIPARMEEFGAAKIIGDALDIKDLLIRDRISGLNATASNNISLGGPRGAGGQATVKQLMDPSFVKNLRSLNVEGVNVDELVNIAVKRLADDVTAYSDIQEVVDKGLANPEVLVLLSSKTIDNATITDSASNDAFLMDIDGYRAGVNLEDTTKFTESVKSFGTKARKISVESKKENGNERASKAQVGQVLRAQLARVVTDSRREDINIIMGEDGIPVVQQVRFSKGIASVGQGSGISSMQKQIEALVGTYAEFSKFGLADMSDLSELALAQPEREDVKVQSRNPIGRVNAQGQAQQRQEDGDTGPVEIGRRSAQGWLGPVTNNVDGVVNTELSVSFDDVLGGGEIPLLVPTLTKKEIETLNNMQIYGSSVQDKDGNSTVIPESIKQKAIKHALERDKKGLSPFFSGDEEQPDVSGLEDGVYEDDQGNQYTVIGGAIQ